jgi:probable phosphoglycerate mutase
MPTRIYLVRHGATQLTQEDRFAGSSDVNLSAEGQRQVASLAERLKNDKLDAIYTSPLGRTLETARILGSPHGLQPIPEPCLTWFERTSRCAQTPSFRSDAALLSKSRACL